MLEVGVNCLDVIGAVLGSENRQLAVVRKWRLVPRHPVMPSAESTAFTPSGFLSVGQIQGVCDPTNTHNVWIANYVGVDVQQILRRTIVYVWPVAAVGLVVASVLFL